MQTTLKFCMYFLSVNTSRPIGPAAYLSRRYIYTFVVISLKVDIISEPIFCTEYIDKTVFVAVENPADSWPVSSS